VKIKKVTIAFVAATVLLGLTFSLFSSGTLVEAREVKSPSISATEGIGVYADSLCTKNLTLIDWGTISAGQSVPRILYVMNLGKFPLRLSLQATNLVPATANGQLTLTWNQEGTKLFSKQIKMATLTLTLSPEISGVTTFDMDVIISGMK
jgi:hypothetical protein